MPTFFSTYNTFRIFFKWVKGMPDQVKHPLRYTEKVFEKYPERIIRKVLKDSTTTSLRRFRENVGVYERLEEERAKNKG